MRSTLGYTRDGWNAYCEGVALDAVPHPAGTLKSAQWREGWLSAAVGDELAYIDDDADADPLAAEAERDDAENRRHAAAADVRRILRRAERLLPPLHGVEAAIAPASSWPMNCHAVALALLKTGLLAPLETEFGTARTCYGIYTGPINGASPFAGKRFPRHGWIELDSGLVVDPTRWVFTGEMPTLACVRSDEYDLGANRLRAMLRPTAQPPLHDAADAVLHWLPTLASTPVVEALLADTSRIADGFLTRPQAAWLANLPMGEFGDATAQVYRDLVVVGAGALIPVDNLNYAGLCEAELVPAPPQEDAYVGPAPLGR